MVPRVANSHPWFSGPMEICRNHLRLFHHATFELHSLQGIDFSVAEPIDFQEKWPLKRGDPIPSRGWNNCFPHWTCHQLVSVPKWQIRRLWLRENTCSIVILCAMVPDNAQCLLTLETEITPKAANLVSQDRPAGTLSYPHSCGTWLAACPLLAAVAIRWSSPMTLLAPSTEFTLLIMIITVTQWEQPEQKQKRTGDESIPLGPSEWTWKPGSRVLTQSSLSENLPKIPWILIFFKITISWRKITHFRTKLSATPTSTPSSVCRAEFWRRPERWWAWGALWKALVSTLFGRIKILQMKIFQ